MNPAHIVKLKLTCVWLAFFNVASELSLNKFNYLLLKSLAVFLCNMSKAEFLLE